MYFQLASCIIIFRILNTEEVLQASNGLEVVNGNEVGTPEDHTEPRVGNLGSEQTEQRFGNGTEVGTPETHTEPRVSKLRSEQTEQWVGNDDSVRSGSHGGAGSWRTG